MAYDSLWNLHSAGLCLVAVTGRPSGWGELLVRQWPIDGCVTENGAVYLVRTKAEGGAGAKGGPVVRRDACDPPTRQERRERLARLVRASARWCPRRA